MNKPYFPAQSTYRRYIAKMYENGWLTNNGPLVQEFGQRLREYLDVPFIVMTSSGTAALQLAYKLFSLSGNVITSPYSFVATCCSIEWVGLDIKFADIASQSLNIKPSKIEMLVDRDTSAIVPVHTYGNPCNVELIQTIAKQNNLKVIYDAAHAFGIRYKNKSLLSYGDASALSLHATKLFHCIEGGALILNKQDDFERAKRMINFGVNTQQARISENGFNGKLSEAHAAMGLAMLDDVEKVLERRFKLFYMYKKALGNSVSYPKWDTNANQNGAYFPIILETEEQTTKVFNSLKEKNIQSRRYFSPSLNTLRQYAKGQRFECSTSESIVNRVLCLPLFYDLTEKDIQVICNTVLGAL